MRLRQQRVPPIFFEVHGHARLLELLLDGMLQLEARHITRLSLVVERSLVFTLIVVRALKHIVFLIVLIGAREIRAELARALEAGVLLL